MSYRSNSPPVSGFAGHVPGHKWQVGGSRQNNSSLTVNPNSNNRENFGQPSSVGMQNGSFNQEQMAQMYQQHLAQLQASGQMPMMPQFYGFNPYLTGNGGFNPSLSMHGLNQISPNNQYQQQQQQQVPFQGQGSAGGAQEQRGQTNRPETSQKNRSKSVPRKPKSDVKDVFGGIESGWWSEGQALKNLRRHQQGMVEGDNINDNNSTFSLKSTGRRRVDLGDDTDVPTAGYSGHVPGIRQYGIGKPFTVAAKEARRHMHPIDTTEISSSSANSAAIKARNNNPNGSSASLASSQQNMPIPSANGFQYPISGQNPYMQSYPYGMMPMYMNNLQQMPMTQMPQPPSEYGPH